MTLLYRGMSGIGCATATRSLSFHSINPLPIPQTLYNR